MSLPLILSSQKWIDYSGPVGILKQRVARVRTNSKNQWNTMESMYGRVRGRGQTGLVNCIRIHEEVYSPEKYGGLQTLFILNNWREVVAFILLVVILLLVGLFTYIIEISGIGQIVNNIGLGWTPFNIIFGIILFIIVFRKWYDIENQFDKRLLPFEKKIDEFRRKEEKEHLKHEEELRKQISTTQEILKILKLESDSGSLHSRHGSTGGRSNGTPSGKAFLTGHTARLPQRMTSGSQPTTTTGQQESYNTSMHFCTTSMHVG